MEILCCRIPGFSSLRPQNPTMKSHLQLGRNASDNDTFTYFREEIQPRSLQERAAVEFLSKPPMLLTSAKCSKLAVSFTLKPCLIFLWLSKRTFIPQAPIPWLKASQRLSLVNSEELRAILHSSEVGAAIYFLQTLPQLSLLSKTCSARRPKMSVSWSLGLMSV